jgi:acetolactate synthase-1/2/3 large subunit
MQLGGIAAMSDTKKASDVFIECLEAEGCEYIFGVPGEENLDFLDSLSRSKQIKLILTRHEQGAGFMAATYGRHTGRTGVCVATLGPGATNFVTSAAYAQLGGMPVLMITGQKPIKKSKQGRFQIVDIVALMKPITKYAIQIAAGDNIPSRVREAYRLAEEEKPGATLIELPEDIAEEPTTDWKPLPKSIARRPSGRAQGRARRSQGDRERQESCAGDRRGCQPQDVRKDARTIRREDRHSVPDHPDGQGRD